jgi:hypothetical protein
MGMTVLFPRWRVIKPVVRQVSLHTFPMLPCVNPLACNAMRTPHTQARLTQMLRAQKRVYWTVNSYLRSVLSGPKKHGREDFEPPKKQGREDFEPPPAGEAWGGAALADGVSGSSGGGGERQRQQGGEGETAGETGVAAAAAAAEEAPPPPSLVAALPLPFLEEVLSHVDAATLCRAACSCRAMSLVRLMCSRRCLDTA